MPKRQAQAEGAESPPLKRQGKSHPFCVVGIGASAGGLEACRKLLESLPDAPGLAFVLVQHLDPTHESMMVNLLAGSTAMSVAQAAEGMLIEVDHFYIIPPGTYLSIKEGRLHLSAPKARHGSRLPFDFLLLSLADSYGECSASIILSGTGADGSQGLVSIRQAGGLVLAQQFEEAGFDGMPRNAVLTGSVNEVLPVAEMPTALARFFKCPDVPKRTGLTAGTASSRDWPGEILDLLKTRTAQDLAMYKQGTVERRIARRMAMSTITPGNNKGYLELLRTNTAELDLLAKDLLIHVTSFFRDPHVFEYLATTIVPGIIEAHKSQDPLRIWIAGCSTGEETYSLVILFHEAIARRKANIKIQVFASDIDPEAISHAREGTYPDSIASDVSAERLTAFFTKENKGYKVRSEIRASVVFTVQDILADPPFSRMDFVSCRNLLIYLRPEAQAKVIALFRFSLTEGGLLLLGRAETIGGSDATFKIVSKSHRLYRRVGWARNGDFGFQLKKTDLVRPSPRLSKGKMAVPSSLADLCRRTVIDIYSPAAVLINSRHECLYHLGRTDRYLQMAAGYPTHDVLEMMPRAVRSKLKSAVEDAGRSHKPSAVSGACVTRDEFERRFHMVVHPILHDAAPLFLVCFFDEPTAGPMPKRTTAAISKDRAIKLEEELEATKHELQSALSELQLTGEEQRAVNEEALSVNEEYQSTNEELETSKEELQSLNEELTALNTQLQETLDRQRTTSNDLQNVLYSTNVATLFLDTALNIRFFTPATRSLFNVIQSDVGRPIGDLTSLAEDGALSADAHAVLLKGEPREKEIEGKDGSWYIRRILPYMTTERNVEGVVVTFSNITERHHGSAALEAAKRLAEQANSAKSQFLAAASHDLRQPLQTIALIQGLLARTVDGAKAKLLVERLDESLVAMSGMLNTLLDINQIEAGTVHADLVVFPINDLLQRLGSEFDHLAKAQGLRLRVVPCRLSIRSDPRLLEQMLRNILSNALKYTKRGGILIGCRRREGKLSIEIWDTGIGIPASALQSVFEEYRQLDNPARERSRGLGLGLSIVQRLGALMKQAVTVQSQVGRGSVFKVAALIQADLDHSLPPPPHPGASETPSKRPGIGTILLVEDEPDVRDLTAQLLNDIGHKIITASDGADAIAVVEKSSVRLDLIMTDFNLPNGMNGIEVTEALRQRLPYRLPAIILTGDISTETLRSIAQVDCLQMNKPVKLGELSAAIEHILSSKSPVPRSIDAEGSSRQPIIVIVDDDDLLRGMMRDTLEGHGYKVEDYASCEAFLDGQLPAGDACLLIDAYLPGMSGLELLNTLRRQHWKIPTIMITGNSDVAIAVEAMKAGASDFIEKPIGASELIAGIEAAIEYQRDTKVVPAWRRTAAAHFAGLTPRQSEIMRMVLAGHPNKNIAADLGISQRTVENHRASIMKKTGSRSLPALARLAMAADWSSSGDIPEHENG